MLIKCDILYIQLNKVVLDNRWYTTKTSSNQGGLQYPPKAKGLKIGSE